MMNNWISPNAAQFWAGYLTGAVVNGWNTNIGANNKPMFVNDAAHDYRPAVGSPLINAGASLGDLGANAMPVSHLAAMSLRKLDGVIDIGAFEV